MCFGSHHVGAGNQYPVLLAGEPALQPQNSCFVVVGVLFIKSCSASEKWEQEGLQHHSQLHREFKTCQVCKKPCL